MATRKTKKEKPKPPIRFFAGGEMFYAGEYDSSTGKCTTTYHNKDLQDSLELKWSKRLTEAARTIIAEDPDTGLLNV